MRKYAVSLVIVLSMMGVWLAPGLPVAAQDPVLVWQAVTPDAGAVFESLADAYEQQTGVPVVIEYMPPQVLFESVKTANTAGAGGPDVVITGSVSLTTLREPQLINAQRASGAFFLSDLVDTLPDLLTAECGTDPVADCLWPRLAPSLAVQKLEDRTLSRAWDWLCSAADWMLPCEGADWPGAALSWYFNIYLINETWLAENGVDVPVSVEEIDNVRSQYGVEYVWAEESSIPLASEARPGVVYIMPSSLIEIDPNGLMRAMDSFYQAGYLPVLELGIDGAYVSATTTNPTQAADFVSFVDNQTDFKAALATATETLPAVRPNALSDLGTDAVRNTLRAVLTLVSYSTIAY